MFNFIELSKTDEYKLRAKQAYERDNNLANFNRQRRYVDYYKEDHNNKADTAGSAFTTALGFTNIGKIFSLVVGEFYKNKAKKFINYRARLQHDVLDERERNLKSLNETENTDFSNFILQSAEDQLPSADASIETLQAYKKELFHIPPGAKLYASDRYNELIKNIDSRIETKLSQGANAEQIQQTQLLGEYKQYDDQLLSLLLTDFNPQELAPGDLIRVDVSPAVLSQRVAELNTLLPELPEQVIQEIAKLNEQMFTKTAGELRTIKTILENREAIEQEQQQQALQAAVIQQKLASYDGAAQSFSFVSQLGRAIGSKPLVQIGVVGESLMKISSAQTVLSAGTAAGFAALGPISVIAFAGLAIFDVFGSKGDDPNKIIMQMLQQITQEIRDLHEDMREHFQEVFERFDALFRFCFNGFEKINEILLNTITPRLNQIQTTLDGIADYIERAELDARLANISLSINQSEGRSFTALESIAYDNSLRPLAHHASFTTVESYSNCASRTLAENDPRQMMMTLRALANSDSKMLMASNIDFLREITPVIAINGPIPNPIMWSAAAKYYANLMSHHMHPINGPKFDRTAISLQEIGAIIQLGKRYADYILSLKENIGEIYRQQFLAYHQSLDNVCAVIESIEHEFNQQLQIDNPAIRERRPIDGITLGTDIVTFAQEHYAGYEKLEKVKYQFTQPPYAACGQFGRRFDEAAKPTHIELISAACHANPQLTNSLLNLATAMGIGQYYFTFYTDVSNGSKQQWSSQMGPNGEKNGLTTVFKFKNGPQYQLSKAGPHVIWWRSITDEKGNIPEQDRLYSRLIYSVTNQGNNITTSGHHDWGGPQTTYTPLNTAQTEQVINLVDAELCEKRVDFKRRVLEAADTDLFYEAEQQRSLLITLLKLVGFSQGNIINKTLAQMQQLEKLATLFATYDPNTRALPDYQSVLRTQDSALTLELDEIYAMDHDDENTATSEYIDTIRLLSFELETGLAASTAFNSDINAELNRLEGLKQQLENMPYCESDDESDAIDAVDQTLSEKIIRRPNWRYVKNAITGQRENIGLMPNDRIYHGMLRSAEYAEQPVLLRSTPLPEEIRRQDITEILSTAQTWQGLGLLHGVTQHVNKINSTRRHITIVTKPPETDLENYLTNLYRSGLLLNKKQQLLLILHITLNLREMHIRNMTHGHLNPSNIGLFNRVTEGDRDFYSARISDVDTTQMSTEQDQQYQAPEVGAGQRAQAAADIFSLSIIIWRILQHGKPYDAQATKPFDLGQHANDFPFLVRIMQSCNQTDPRARLSVDAVIAKILQWDKQDMRKVSDTYYPGFFAASTQNNPIERNTEGCRIM